VRRGQRPETLESRAPCPSRSGKCGMGRKGFTTQPNHHSQRSAPSGLERPAPSIPCTCLNFGVLGMIGGGLKTQIQGSRLAAAPPPARATRRQDASLDEGATIRATEDYSSQLLRASGAPEAPRHVRLGMRASPDNLGITGRREHRRPYDEWGHGVSSVHTQYRAVGDRRTEPA
jgi:hypothetical protein